MAAVKLDKAARWVTGEEARAALADATTSGDAALTGQTMRAGESAFINALRERGVYDSRFASWRHTANRYLDRGEVTVMVTPTPTRKRPSGRPGRQRGFCEMGGDAGLVHHRLGRSSLGRTGRRAADRTRSPTAMPSVPVRRGWRCLTAKIRIGRRTNLLRWTATKYAPELIEDARRQGEIARAGGSARRDVQQRVARTFALSSPTARSVEECSARGRSAKILPKPLRSPHRRRP